MHKILGFVALAINGMVWLGTFESSRAQARNSRPEIREILKKEAALALVEKEKSESTALVGGVAPQPPSVSDEKLLADYAILSGDMQGETQGREYRYSADIRFWKTGPEAMDPGVWKAQILLMNSENFHYLNVYKASPKVQQGVITLMLEEQDKAQTFTDYSSHDISVPIKKIVITIDAQGQIRAGAEDEYGVKWAARLSKIDPATFDNLMGTWKGKIVQDVPVQLTLQRNGHQIAGEMLYKHSVGTCTGKVKGVIHQGDQLFIVGGPMNAHTACIGNYVLRVRSFENQMVGGYYDYLTKEPDEFKLTH